MCKMIAENPENKNRFSSIVTLCDDLAVDNEANPDLKSSMIGSKGPAARRRLRQPRLPENLAAQSHGTNKQPLAYVPPPPPDEYQPPLPQEPPPQPPLPLEPPPPKL